MLLLLICKLILAGLGSLLLWLLLVLIWKFKVVSSCLLVRLLVLLWRLLLLRFGAKLPTWDLVRLTTSFLLASWLQRQILTTNQIVFLLTVSRKLREKWLAPFLLLWWWGFQIWAVNLWWWCLDPTYLKCGLGLLAIISLGEFTPWFHFINKHVLRKLLMFNHFWPVNADSLWWLMLLFCCFAIQQYLIDCLGSWLRYVAESMRSQSIDMFVLLDREFGLRLGCATIRLLWLWFVSEVFVSCIWDLPLLSLILVSLDCRAIELLSFCDDPSDWWIIFQVNSMSFDKIKGQLVWSAVALIEHGWNIVLPGAGSFLRI